MLRAWSNYLKAQRMQRRSANALAKARRLSLTDDAQIVSDALAVDTRARARLAKAKTTYRTTKREALAHA